MQKNRENADILDARLKSIGKLGLGLFPTPVHRLYRLEKDLEYNRIYIKRDDMTGIGAGGNKIRSLEFLLQDAKMHNCDVVIASGPVQSNLCTLAANASAKAGLDCILVHNGAIPCRKEGNLLLNWISGVKSHFLGEVSLEARSKYVESLYQKLIEEGHRPYIIQNGATCPVGSLGYVSAALELYRQNIDGALEIEHIFAPGGNGGVACGLIYGNAILGYPFQIHIISVDDTSDVLMDNIKKVMFQLRDLVGIDLPKPVEESCSIYDGYTGGGWGKNTPESEQAVMSLPRLEGIYIENIYTSKTLVGMINMIRQGEINGNVCYLHTGGLGSLFGQYDISQ